MTQADRGPGPAPFAIEEESEGPGTVVLNLRGEVDLAVADRLQAALERTAPEDVVVIDLARCEFVDSTALAVLLRGQQRQRNGGGRLVLCEPARQVLRILEVSGLIRDGLVVAERSEALRD